MSPPNGKIIETTFWLKVEGAREGLMMSDEQSHFSEVSQSSRYRDK
jgi:hypothetical protein